jgi:imidazoleglycerol-phosphate dehydratase
MRTAKIHRTTSETEIKLSLNLDGSGVSKIDTGIGFLDHMLNHVAVHGLFDLELSAKGDIHIDPHHTMEDCALALGAAFDQALEERRGIVRMASTYAPMDESLAWTNGR